LTDENNTPISIAIPRRLYKRISAKIKDIGFPSVSKYVEYVLERELSSIEEEKIFSNEDEARVKEKLRRLGYI